MKDSDKTKEELIEELRQAKDELETRVAERTAELLDLKGQLQLELEESKQAQEDLQVSQSLFAGILESIEGYAIFMLDPKGYVVSWNTGAQKIKGYRTEEIIGQHFSCFYTSEDIQQSKPNQDLQQAAIAGHFEDEGWCIRQDKSKFCANTIITALGDQAGQLRGFSIVTRDITDRQAVERMKNEFISVVSHELRTPLTSLHGSLGMLASGLLDPHSERGKRLLEIAVDSTDRLVRLINDILDIERIESGKVQMDKQTCNAADLMNETADVMQSMAQKAGVSLEVSTVTQKLWVDPDRIIQTLTNLLSNAIKFSPQSANVWLTAEVQEDEILFQVKDHGRGIPADKLETIFERFQQVDASDSRNQDGTGLGLAICRSILQHHNGKIWVESTLGEGSTFYFTLPILQEKQAIAPVAPSLNPLVLICDDDASIRTVLQTLLEQRSYRVILDIILPDGDGFAVVEWLQQHNSLQSIPLVMYSAKDLDDSEKNRLRLGHTEVLTKSRVTLQEFDQRVMSLLQSITQHGRKDGNHDSQTNSSD